MTGNVSKKLAINAQNGKDGVGIARWYTENDSLYIVLTDGRTIEVGNLKGPGATVKIGSVEFVDDLEDASVTNDGTDTDAILNIKIPKGKDGDVTERYLSIFQSVLSHHDSAYRAAESATDAAVRVESIIEDAIAEATSAAMGYAGSADSAATTAITAADRAESAASSVDSENIVHKTGDEYISGTKTFKDNLILEDGRILGVNGVYISGDGPCTVKDAYGDSIEMNHGDVNIKSSSGKVYANGKNVATEEYVDNSINTIGIKTITLDEFNALTTPNKLFFVTGAGGENATGLGYIIEERFNGDGYPGSRLYILHTSMYTILVREVNIDTGELITDYWNALTAHKAEFADVADTSYCDEKGNNIVDTYATKKDVSALAAPTKASVNILGGAQNWTLENIEDGSGNVVGSRYGQVVNVNNATITPNSKVDLQLTSEQTAVLFGKGLAFVAENDGGVVTVYCVGSIPEDNYTFQAVVTEVVVNA